MQIVPLELIFNEYYDRLVYFSFKIVNDKQDAEDAVQEAFVKYWNNKERISGEQSMIKSYLYTTVRNISLNIVRHRRVVKDFEQRPFSLAEKEEDVINKIIQTEVLTKICAVMASMPDGCRKISWMGYIDGMKNREIAEELGVSMNTVKTQKQRGAKILRTKLIPELIISFYLMLSGWMS